MSRRIQAIVSILLICGIISGCSFQKRTRLEQQIPDSSLHNVHIETAVSGVRQKATAWQKSILEQMELKLENEYLQLYLGEYHDIAIYDKEADKIFFSGEALYPEDGSNVPNATKQMAATQVSIEYFNLQSSFRTKHSYPDSYIETSYEQILVENKDEKLRVEYTLGQREEEYFFAPAIRNETMDWMKENSRELIEEGTLKNIDYRNFVTAYRKLSTNVMSDSMLREYTELYPNLPELEMIYAIKQNVTRNQKRSTEATFRAFGFTEEMLLEEEEAIGSSNAYQHETEYFVIPLEYSLEGRSLVVSVDTPEIISTPGIHLTKIHLLNTFGASSIEYDGYTFLPDGSGSIVENDTSVYGMSAIDIPFYGHDFGRSFESFDILPPHAHLPVFGIKQGDSAIFGIVTSNEAMSGVIGRVSVANLDYNCAYPYFNYYVRDYLNKESSIYKFSQVKPQTNSTVRYFFLYGDDANYSGMARLYQEYLIKTGQMTDGIVADDWKLDIRLIGAINKVVRTVGVPIKRVVPTTTFPQAREIIARLHENQISNLDIIYSEVLSGAREYKAPVRVNILNQLGGLDQYNELIKYSAGLGYDIFTFADFGKVFKRGNGILNNSDVIMKMNSDSSMLYDKDTIPANIVVPTFVNPERYSQMVDRFCSSLIEVNSNNVYLPTWGYYLNGNYYDRAELTRGENMTLTIQAAEKLDHNGINSKFDGCNSYLLPYAHSLINVPLESSATRLESFSVPFISMIFKGYVDFSGVAINSSGDFQKSLLNSIESGAGLYYEIMAAEPFVLSGTNYTNMYSVSSDIWLDHIIESYNRVNDEMKNLADQKIYSHERLDETAVLIIYEEGSKVLVNYGVNSYIYSEDMNYVVPGNDFIVIRP